MANQGSHRWHMANQGSRRWHMANQGSHRWHMGSQATTFCHEKLYSILLPLIRAADIIVYKMWVHSLEASFVEIPSPDSILACWSSRQFPIRSAWGGWFGQQVDTVLVVSLSAWGELSIPPGGTTHGFGWDKTTTEVLKSPMCGSDRHRRWCPHPLRFWQL